MKLIKYERRGEISAISLALKVLKAYSYLRRFEFHIVSVVIEYPLYQGNIIHCPCGSSDSLSQKENDFHRVCFTCIDLQIFWVP